MARIHLFDTMYLTEEDLKDAAESLSLEKDIAARCSADPAEPDGCSALLWLRTHEVTDSQIRQVKQPFRPVFNLQIVVDDMGGARPSAFWYNDEPPNFEASREDGTVRASRRLERAAGPVYVAS